MLGSVVVYAGLITALCGPPDDRGSRAFARFDLRPATSVSTMAARVP